MKNAFYFTLKALFVLKIFKVHFCLDFLVMLKNGLIRKIRLISRMTSQPGKQIIAVHILSNISRSKGQLNLISRQVKNRPKNMMEKLFPNSFLKNQN